MEMGDKVFINGTFNFGDNVNVVVSNLPGEIFHMFSGHHFTIYLLNKKDRDWLDIEFLYMLPSDPRLSLQPHQDIDILRGF